MRPGDIVPFQWSFALIALSYSAAVVGSYLALRCAATIPLAGGRVNRNALWAAATALGGGAIWFMHFIGMAAFVTPPAIAVQYDVLTTIVSMLAAIIVAAFALYLVGRDPKKVTNILAGGVIAGCGVAIMHYLGMGAMRMRALIQWDTTIVGISVLIAIVAAIAALWLTFNTRSRVQRLLAALVMGVAVCGMHYTGMYAGTFICTTELATTGPTMGGPYFFQTVLIFGALLLGAVSIFHALGSTEASGLDERRQRA